MEETFPWKCCTYDDNKSKPQIFKFYDFSKGGTDIFDQINDYFTTIAKIFEMDNDCSLLNAGHNSENYLMHKKRN